VFPSTPEWRCVAAAAEVPPGGRRVVPYDDARVLLLNVEGDLYAFESVCPHQYFPLDDCFIEDGRLECPYHGFSYRLATGDNHYPACVYPERLSYLKAQIPPLTRFRVRIEAEGIWIAPVAGQ
jgi:3-phenylpropionate/trans-cinnamate dioxygenase ferredoxin subunit